ncbi:uncharacterized protein [Nicotiana tomentosiformis]|uniref:uncharacterized protein n=1 Tax=Nicotiana tomentosiformis TaxID=4098 RepID=UPI00388C868F
MDIPKKERSLALRITESFDLEDDEMAMITKDFKKYLRRGKGSSRSGSYSKEKAPEKQTDDGCHKCGKPDHHIKNYPLWEIEWKKEKAERRNRKNEQVQPKKSNNKGSTKAMVAAWGESSNESSDGDDEDERALMAIGESDEETEVSVFHLKDKIKFLSKERLFELLLELIDESEDINNKKEQLSKECVILNAKCKNLELRASETVSENTVLKNQVHALDSTVLELRSENLKFKLGTGKKTVDHTQLTLEENIGKIKNELYKRDEQLQEHHINNIKGLGFGNRAPKWDPKSKYLTLPKNKICTHCDNTGHYKSECTAKEKASQKNKDFVQGCQVQVKGNNQIGYMDSGCSKHITGSKNQFLSLEDLKGDNELTCLSVLDNDPLLWHKRLGDVSLSQLNKLVSKNLVIGLPNNKFKEDKVCEACARGKHVRSSFQSGKMVSITRTMELVHMDLCGPMRILSRDGKRYIMVLVDDYSRFTWTLFLTSKDEAFDMFTSFNNDKDSLGNFDPISDEGVFLGYSSHSKAYKIYNKRTMCVEESVHVVFDETNIHSKRQEHDDEAIGLANQKESHLTAVKKILRYLKGTTDLCLWYLKDSNFNLVGYADADYAEFLVDRKSTSDMAHFLGSCLVSWATKKQNSMVLSTAEAKYVVAASCCAQLLWIKQQLMDFGIDIGCIPIFYNDTSAISMTKNPVHHKRTKHIYVRHHFLKDNYEKGLITIEFCASNKQIADIFTKSLSRDHFERNMLEIGMIKIT